MYLFSVKKGKDTKKIVRNDTVIWFDLKVIDLKKWRARVESNHRPLASEANTLSG